MRFLALHLCLSAVFYVSGLTTPVSTTSPSCRPSLGNSIRKKRWNPKVLRASMEALTENSSSSSSVYSDDNDDGNGNDDDDDEERNTTTPSNSNININSNGNGNENDNDNDAVVSSLPKQNAPFSDSDGSSAISTSTSAFRWKRRKQIAMGLVASIATTVGAAKAGWLGAHYTDSMIAQDAFMTGLTSVLAVILNRAISWGFENGKYDSNTARKISHITSAPLFIVTWPFFSAAGGARVFAGLVTLTNMYRLYLAGTGDAAESTLAKTISRTGDKSEVLGGPFIYVCLFQFFIMVFWRHSFPGVVAMTTLAGGDGIADIIGRRYGRNGTKWPFGDGQKSLVGTVAFAVFSFGLTLGVTSWLIATGALTSSLAFPEMARNILAISCICALVEVLPGIDDNFTVPGSAALLSWLWLR